MTDLWLRLVRFFIEPPPEALADRGRHSSRHAGRMSAAAPVAAAIAAPSDLWPAAGLVAADLRARCDARVAVVCAWTPGGFDPTELSPPLALPATRRIAARLAARGHDAAACGALCRLRLAADPDEALTSATTVIAITDEPIVLALGLDHPAFADLLTSVDEVFVLPAATSDPALLDLLARGRPTAQIVPTPGGPIARQRATLGLGPRVVRTALPSPVVDAAYAPPQPPILERR